MSDCPPLPVLLRQISEETKAGVLTAAERLWAKESCLLVPEHSQRVAASSVHGWLKKKRDAYHKHAAQLARPVNMPSVSELPPEDGLDHTIRNSDMLRAIFAFLDTDVLYNASDVCRLWERVIGKDWLSSFKAVLRTACSMPCTVPDCAVSALYPRQWKMAYFEARRQHRMWNRRRFGKDDGLARRIPFRDIPSPLHSYFRTQLDFLVQQLCTKSAAASASLASMLAKHKAQLNTPITDVSLCTGMPTPRGSIAVVLSDSDANPTSNGGVSSVRDWLLCRVGDEIQVWHAQCKFETEPQLLLRVCCPLGLQQLESLYQRYGTVGTETHAVGKLIRDALAALRTVKSVPILFCMDTSSGILVVAHGATVTVHDLVAASKAAFAPTTQSASTGAVDGRMRASPFQIRVFDVGFNADSMRLLTVSEGLLLCLVRGSRVVCYDPMTGMELCACPSEAPSGVAEHKQEDDTVEVAAAEAEEEEHKTSLSEMDRVLLKARRLVTAETAEQWVLPHTIGPDKASLEWMGYHYLSATELSRYLVKPLCARLTQDHRRFQLWDPQSERLSKEFSLSRTRSGGGDEAGFGTADVCVVQYVAATGKKTVQSQTAATHASWGEPAGVQMAKAAGLRCVTRVVTLHLNGAVSVWDSRTGVIKQVRPPDKPKAHYSLQMYCANHRLVMDQSGLLFVQGLDWLFDVRSVGAAMKGVTTRRIAALKEDTVVVKTMKIVEVAVDAVNVLSMAELHSQVPTTTEKDRRQRDALKDYLDKAFSPRIECVGAVSVAATDRLVAVTRNDGTLRLYDLWGDPENITPQLLATSRPLSIPRLDPQLLCDEMEQKGSSITALICSHLSTIGTVPQDASPIRISEERLRVGDSVGMRLTQHLMRSWYGSEGAERWRKWSAKMKASDAQNRVDPKRGVVLYGYVTESVGEDVKVRFPCVHPDWRNTCAETSFRLNNSRLGGPRWILGDPDGSHKAGPNTGQIGIGAREVKPGVSGRFGVPQYTYQDRWFTPWISRANSSYVEDAHDLVHHVDLEVKGLQQCMRNEVLVRFGELMLKGGNNIAQQLAHANGHPVDVPARVVSARGIWIELHINGDPTTRWFDIRSPLLRPAPRR